MKKFVFSAILLGCFVSIGCGAVSPNAGTEAVLVSKPLFFGSGGVHTDPVKPGLVWVAMSTDAVYVNMQPRQQAFGFDDLFTKDGVPLDFHATVQYQIVDSVKLVKDFGADDTEHGMGFFVRVLDQPFRALVRDAVKKHGLNEMAINASAAQEVDDEISTKFASVVTTTGVPIKVISVTLGRANPPDAIKHQRVATAEQEQRIKTEQQRKLAEDQRKGAEESRAVADQIYNERMGLNSEQYLRLEQIKALSDVCGKGNCTFITGSVTPLVSVK